MTPTSTTCPLQWSIAPSVSLSLDRPRLIAIINATPDSFSDGGLHSDPHQAAQFAEEAIDAGAWALDVGGESTRPGAARVSADEQINRTIPVIRAFRERGIDAPISIDTTLAPVARAALDEGAQIINDVSAGLEDPDILSLAAKRNCGLILMHRLVPPDQDRYSTDYTSEPHYPDRAGGVVGVVKEFLRSRVDAAMSAGVDPGAIVLDPGLGFGKSANQNWELIRRADELANLGHPVLSAASRKSFIGAAMDEPEPANRLTGSIAVSVLQYMAGLRLFRVHDVAAHAQALAIATRLSP